MRIINNYSLKNIGLEDKLIVYFPSDDQEKKEIFKFRYFHYFKNGYIDFNSSSIDFDKYDNCDSTVTIAVKSEKHQVVLACVRIIRVNPLPIIKDCFIFREPFFIKFFGQGKIFEVSRLIIDRYSKDYFLPRHLILFIIIKEIFFYSRNNRYLFSYAFIKRKLFIKLKKIYFPLFQIKNYTLKYKSGVLFKYFNQNGDPVIPVYFNLFFVGLYLLLFQFKYKKYYDISH